MPSPGPFPCLGDFLSHLESQGELARVKTQVDPVLEIAAIADRVMKSSAPTPRPHGERDKHPYARLGGRALLFENVKESDFPVAINVFGSYRRVCDALGTDTLDALADRVGKFVKPVSLPTLADKLKFGRDAARDLRGLLPNFTDFLPRLREKSAPCQDVVLEGKDADLTRLPVLQCWPLDGDLDSGQLFDEHDAGVAAAAEQPRTGRYITLAGIHTVHPDSRVKNVGMYRVQIFGPRLAAMHWHLHHDGARHFREWQRKGEKMPLAVVLGGESVLPYAATAPLPPGIGELLFAGFLNRSRIELTRCRTIDLDVPVNAEIVIEGYVDPHEALLEGPFGDHTGFYSLADRYPAFHVTAVTHRRGAVYPTTIVGKPPMEDYFLGKATERIFLPLLKVIVPDILDYSLPAAGCFHNCAYVKIRKEYAYQARRVMHAIWGAGQMAFTKFLIVVDEDVDVHDEQDVLFHLFANCDPQRDMELVRGPVDILDHASPGLGVGSKIGFDATRKWKGETTDDAVRRWPKELAFDAATKSLVESRWREYGL